MSNESAAIYIFIGLQFGVSLNTCLGKIFFCYQMKTQIIYVMNEEKYRASRQ